MGKKKIPVVTHDDMLKQMADDTLEKRIKATKAELKVLKSEKKRRKQIKKHDCIGCEDDFYNKNGERECWGLKTAKMILRKKVPLSQAPPWNQRQELLPSCYRVKGYVLVEGSRVK